MLVQKLESKQNLHTKFEQLEIARWNAARNSSRKILLREEKTQKKRLSFLIVTESDFDQIPSGQPGQGQKSEKAEIIIRLSLNMSIKTMKVDDCNDLIR